ncbi:MAG: hypothetical protein ABJG41_09955 [Cyclobacteriaceae bacterium]
MANNTDRRNKEILMVWDYLRKERRHTADFCREFMDENYFADEMYVYKIMKRAESLPDTFDPSKASLIYHLVMTNQYMDLVKYQPEEKEQ